MQLGRHLPLELRGGGGGVASFLRVVFLQLVSVSFSGEFFWRTRDRGKGEFELMLVLLIDYCCSFVLSLVISVTQVR